MSDDVEVLVAPLFADSPGWTSRTVAAATGRTQSAVARVWRRTYQAGRTELGDALPAGGLTLAACSAGTAGSVLIFRPVTGVPPSPCPGGFMRSPARRPLQALLAADLLTTGPAEPLDVPGASGGLALCSSAAVAATVPAGVTTVLIGPGRWQGLLGELVPRLVDVEVLVEAQRRAMKWAVTRRGAFAWVAGPATPARHPVPPNRVPVATTERVAELTLAVLHRDVVAGRLRGGDRVTESYLARGTHASRGQVRDALRVLAGRGVVDLQPNRGAVVPVPGVEDVVETYAARSALGAVIVRRVADSYRPGQIERLEAALQSMLATAGTGDAWATGEDDLRFQEVLGELAATAGMRRVPGMFAALTAQLRMMIAVLGLRYAYSVGDMCADDADLLELIRQRRGAAAAGRWNRKMADAAAYMIEQLRKRETP